MKKIYSIALAAVAILSAASCQKELVNDNFDAAGEKFTVVATAADTKTVLEGNTAYWMPGDKITVFDADGQPVEFTTTITEKAAKAEFTAESFNAPESLVAVYNPTRDATLDAEGKIYPLRVGGGQKPYAGTFDPDAAVAVGTPKSEGSRELVFNNIHSLVKFTVGGDKAPSSVKLVNNGGSILAGLVYWNTNTSAIEHSGAGDPFVTVAGAYEVGQTYYIAVLPNGAKGGLSLYFDDVLMKNTEEDIEIQPNKIYNLGTLPAPTEEPGEAAVVLNELCGNRVYDGNKFIELYNAGNAEANLAGWTLRKYAADATDVEGKYNICWTAPEGTKIAAGEYLVLASDQEDPALGFNAGLSAKKGLKFELVDPQGNVVDKFVRGEDTDPFGEEKLEENTEASFSRVPNGTGDWAYAVPTPGAANGEKTGDIEGYAASEPETPELPEAPQDSWETAAVAVNGAEAVDDSRLKELRVYSDADFMYVRLTATKETPFAANYLDFFLTDGEGDNEVWWGWTTTGTNKYYQEHKCELNESGELTKMRWYLPDETRVYIEEYTTTITDTEVCWEMKFPRSYVDVYKSSTGKIYISFLLWNGWDLYWAIPARYNPMLEVTLM